MAFIIPDKILNNLVCDICHRYLSVLPVKVSPNGVTKCGRCVGTSETDSKGAHSLIGLALKTCLFKCINRFDSCRELFTYSQVRAHENVCVSKVYKCPLNSVCSEDEILSYQLERHFLDEHAESVLEKPVFNVLLDDHLEEQIFYYRLEDQQFMIALKYSRQADIMRLNICLVGSPEQADNVNQQFWISSDHNDFSMSTDKRPCTGFDAENEWFLINMSEMFNKLVTVKFELEITGLQCLTISSKIIKTIEDPHISFKPFVSPFKPRKISLQLINFDNSDIILLSPCRTGIIHLHRLIFLQCLNCHEICWTGANEEFDKFYVCKSSQHSLCYFCFKYLLFRNDIREADYSRTTLPWDIMKKIQFFCKSECGHLLQGSNSELQGPCEFNASVSCQICKVYLRIVDFEKHLCNNHGLVNHLSFGSHYFLLNSSINTHEILYYNNPPVLIELENRHTSNIFLDIKGSLTILLFNEQGQFLEIYDKTSMLDNRNVGILKMISITPLIKH